MTVLSVSPKPSAPVTRDGDTSRLSGNWNVQALAHRKEVVTRQRALTKARGSKAWDLSQIEQMDSVGAQLIWEAWQRKLPAQLRASQYQKDLFAVSVSYTHLTLPTKRIV